MRDEKKIEEGGYGYCKMARWQEGKKVERQICSYFYSSMLEMFENERMRFLFHESYERIFSKKIWKMKNEMV